MRKILLAGAAAVGALALGAPASAQVVNTPSGWSPAAGSPVIQNTPGVQVRFAGRFKVAAQMLEQDGLNASSVTTGESVKVGRLTFRDQGRLWPGFDAMTAGGLRYGAQLEIRFGRTGSGTTSPQDRGTLAYRRMFGYVATPTLGQLRFGSSDGANSLMAVGHIKGNISSGLWDGDLTNIAPAPNVFWYSSSVFNGRTKLTYLSPQFFGFDAGVSFAPTDARFGMGGDCGTPITVGGGGAGCDALSESNLSSQTQRIRNAYELMLRFRGTFAGVGLAASGGYLGSETVGASQGATAGGAFATEGLSIGMFGAQASILGITVGGITTFGKGNYATQTLTTTAAGFTAANTTRGRASLTPLPSGVGADNLFTWQLGATYAVGPFSFGAAYHEAKYEGNVAVGSNAKDRGFGVGGTYAIAPGFNLYAEYLWGTVEEAGVNQISGAAGSGYNKITTNAFLFGTGLNW